jgi:perosamine synthetase
VGFNYRLTDIQAAIGREQLKRIPEAVQERRRLVRGYQELLSDISGLVLPIEPEWSRTNWQSYCVRLPRHLDQREIMQRMLDDGIATRRGVMCAHREAAYTDPTSWRCAHAQCTLSPHCPALVESERAQDHCIILPLFTEMTETQQERVAVSLRSACSMNANAAD